MDIAYYPYFEDDGSISGYVVNAHDITERKQAEEEREKLINELHEAIKEIKTLRGILYHSAPFVTRFGMIKAIGNRLKSIFINIHKPILAIASVLNVQRNITLI